MGFILIFGMLLVVLIPYIMCGVVIAIIIWLISTKLIKSKILKILIILTILIYAFIILINFKDERTNELYVEIKEISDNQSLVGLSKEQVITSLGEPIDQDNEKENKEVYSYNAGRMDKGLFFGNRTIMFDCSYSYELRVVFDENDTVKSTSLKCIP